MVNQPSLEQRKEILQSFLTCTNAADYPKSRSILIHVLAQRLEGLAKAQTIQAFPPRMKNVHTHDRVAKLLENSDPVISATIKDNFRIMWRIRTDCVNHNQDAIVTRWDSYTDEERAKFFSEFFDAAKKVEAGFRALGIALPAY